MCHRHFMAFPPIL
uniref:Uncharacterized protein n=1 Tax=Anguilla anguilla TaxID=7936 RepID=A0A0E9USZ2_ANGAN